MKALMRLGGLLVASLAVNAWLVRRVLAPLRALARKAERLADGELDALEQPCGGVDEIETLRRAMVAMAGHVRRAQQQSAAYAEVLTNAQEAERARIARELHDDTIQALVGMGQHIEIALAVAKERPEQAAAMLRAVRDQAVEAAGNLRNLIGDLRPPALDELGLVAALRMLAGKADIPTTVHVTGAERRLEEAQELALFRIAQEALGNAQRHSHATAVRLAIAYRAGAVELEISDDGAGFESGDDLTALAERGSYGLLGIQERVHNLKGNLAVRSAPGRGTQVKVDVATTEAPQPEGIVRDPVCSALIQPQQAYGHVVYENEVYYFCCPVCKGAFQRDPDLYLHGGDAHPHPA